ncbi:MAG: septum formation protein Maf [Bacteroidia bacterium]|nr:MAG: septum formation protein Maf [Bacteroidia bacterium]
MILVSASPRRKELLERLGWPVEVRPAAVQEEDYPPLEPAQVAMCLAARKVAAAWPTLAEEEVALAADTLVVWEGRILGKPSTLDEAAAFLRGLSGKLHEVYTGVALATLSRTWLLYERTVVRFHPLSEELIQTYLRVSPPLDKAGAYGAQDLIGLAGIAEIHGDFYNVMGLPVQKLVQYWLRVFGPLPG